MHIHLGIVSPNGASSVVYNKPPLPFAAEHPETANNERRVTQKYR